MLRKYAVTTLPSIALLFLMAALTPAQTGELRGHVLIQQADGKPIPAAEAVVDVFRTDLPGKYNTKANKKGEFVFAGLPYLGTYLIAASLASMHPTYLQGVKAGREVDYELVLSPGGDGQRLSLDQIKTTTPQGGASSGSKDSAADRAKREELAKKNAEIAEKNKKVEESNAIVARTFKAGNEALIAKHYDDAVKQYDEGLAADSAQPALLTNKALALKARGVDRYNAAIQSKDDAEKNSGLEAAKVDFRGAAEASAKAIELLKAETAPTDPAELTRATANKSAALNARAESMRLFVTKVDQSQAEAGLAAYQEYIAAETDATKKSKAQMEAAQMLLDAGSGDKAFEEFQKILALQPESPDANLGAGLSLFSSGDKAKYQEAANYLQHFVDLAPDTHKFKADAKAILAELKNTEKVVPEKSTPTRRRRG